MGNPGNTFWGILVTILGILCFPANPLVLTGILEVESYLPLVIAGGIVWAFGMVLVMAPIVMFPRKGGVSKGKAYTGTTLLVDSGIYAVVRHPQYTGGIYAIFITTLLWYPHWLFSLLGAVGIAAIYMSCKVEDKLLIEKFGDDYRQYMQKVPGINVFAGFIKLIKDNQRKGN